MHEDEDDDDNGDDANDDDKSPALYDDDIDANDDLNLRHYMMILMTTMTKPTMMINLRPYVQLSTDQAETMETLGPRLHWAARLIVFFHLFCLHFANFSSAFLPCISFVLALFSDL